MLKGRHNGVLLLLAFFVVLACIAEFLLLKNKTHLDDSALYITQLLIVPTIFVVSLNVGLNISDEMSRMLRNFSVGMYLLYSPRGWYSGATVFRESQKFPANIDRSLLENGRYNIVCDSKNAHLLPLGKRRLEIPKTGNGKKSLGNANVFYLLDESYNVKKDIAPEINKAVRFTEQYKGNFVDSEKDCTQEQIAMVAYEFNPKIRKAIEDYAVKKCTDEYRKRNFHCENVSLKESYDILATKGRTQVKIEVKGTRSAGDSVILTKNEYKLVKKSETRLFLVHSIRMNKDGKMSGGVIVDCKWGDLNLKFEPFYLCKIEEK